MKWNCKEMCKKYNNCVDTDRCIVPSVRRGLKRIENPRRKGRIELIYESEMSELSAGKFEGCVWGDGKKE